MIRIENIPKNGVLILTIYLLVIKTVFRTMQDDIS